VLGTIVVVPNSPSSTPAFSLVAAIYFSPISVTLPVEIASAAATPSSCRFFWSIVPWPSKASRLPALLLPQFFFFLVSAGGRCARQVALASAPPGPFTVIFFSFCGRGPASSLQVFSVPRQFFPLPFRRNMSLDDEPLFFSQPPPLVVLLFLFVPLSMASRGQ